MMEKWPEIHICDQLTHLWWFGLRFYINPAWIVAKQISPQQDGKFGLSRVFTGREWLAFLVYLLQGHNWLGYLSQSVIQSIFEVMIRDSAARMVPKHVEKLICQIERKMRKNAKYHLWPLLSLKLEFFFDDSPKKMIFGHFLYCFWRCHLYWAIFGLRLEPLCNQTFRGGLDLTCLHSSGLNFDEFSFFKPPLALLEAELDCTTSTTQTSTTPDIHHNRHPPNHR